MSINKLISIHDSIYNALKDTGIDITSEVPTFMRWAVDAERKIGSYYGWRKINAVITGEHCRAKLPIECMKVQRVVFGDFGCDCGTLMTNIGNWAINNIDNGAFISNGGDTFLAVDMNPTNPGFTLADRCYEIQNNALVYGSSIDGQKLTIQYLGYEKDCDGFLLVNENHIEALTAFIKWKIAERSRYSPIKMEIFDVRNAKSEWVELRNQARADDIQLTPEDRQQIVNMLHDPYSGYGLQVGMFSNNPYQVNIF